MLENVQRLPYSITLDTFALEPHFEDGRMGTRILEKNRVLYVPQKPIHTVRNSCRYYGNSFESATQSAKLFLNNRHKIPLVIAYYLGRPLIFFPIMSPKSDLNVWIAYHAFVNVGPHELGCIIYLDNNQSIIIDASESTIFRQCALSRILEKEIQKRHTQLDGMPRNF